MSTRRSTSGNARPAPPSGSVSVSVSVSIERLVLDGFGFTPAQGALVQRALEHELARLVQASHSRNEWHGAALPAATAPPMQFAGPAQPARVGRGIACSLFAAIGGRP